MSDKYDFIVYDKRVLERNLRRHEISKADYQKYLKSLSDDEKEADTFKTLFEEESQTSSL